MRRTNNPDESPRQERLRRLRALGAWSMDHHRSQKQARNRRTPRRHRTWNKPKEGPRLVGWRAFA